MREFFANGIVQSVLAAIIFAALVWGFKKMHFWLDERKICAFIKNSKATFRSTEAIVSHTNMEVSRVQLVCSRSKRIRRNTREKESWCLA